MSMREYFKRVHSAMEDFMHLAATVGEAVTTATILLALYLTWPLWAIP